MTVPSCPILCPWKDAALADIERLGAEVKECWAIIRRLQDALKRERDLNLAKTVGGCRAPD